MPTPHHTMHTERTITLASFPGLLHSCLIPAGPTTQSDLRWGWLGLACETTPTITSRDRLSSHSSMRLRHKTSCVASFPGPAQLSIAISTLFHTASDEKLGGAWKRGYLMCEFPVPRACILESMQHIKVKESK